ncbi:MAG: DotU/TssL family secretion system protein [Shimia sp.]
MRALLNTDFQEIGPPILAGAAGIYMLLAEIGTGRLAVPPGIVMDETHAHLTELRRRALDAQGSEHDVEDALYVLSATIDEIMRRTPETREHWPRTGLVATLFANRDARIAGERVFDIHENAVRYPDSFPNTLGVLGMSLLFGFRGRLSLERDGGIRSAEEHREAIDAAIARTRKTEHGADLSDRWEPIVRPGPTGGRRFPVWVMASCGSAAVLFAYMAAWLLLGVLAKDVNGQVQAAIRTAVPTEMIRPLPVDEAEDVPEAIIDLLEGLRTALAPDLAADRVQLVDTGGAIVLRLTGEYLFESGKDDVSDAFRATAGRIVEELRDVAGIVRVEGHTDDRPPRGGAWFETNQNLSELRATSVKATLIDAGMSERRLSSQGFGATRELADNATRAGRETNRRVELVIPKPTY